MRANTVEILEQGDITIIEESFLDGVEEIPDEEFSIEASDIPGGRSWPDAMDGTPNSDLARSHPDYEYQDDKSKEEVSRQSLLESQDHEKLKQECVEAIDKLVDYEAKRSDVNAKMQEIRQKLLAKGISKKALAIVQQISKMDEKEMDGFDLAYKILREAIEKPMQADIFKS